MKTDDALIRNLPYPLGWKLAYLARAARRVDEGEPQPQLAFDVFAFVSALLRVSAIVLLKSYVTRGGTNADINRNVLKTLGQSLVDEKWRDLARNLSKHLSQRADATPLDLGLKNALAAKGSEPSRCMPSVLKSDQTKGGQFDVLDYLVRLRNWMAHGGRVDAVYIRHAVDMVLELAEHFEPLAEFRLVVRTEKGGFALEGDVPVPLDVIDASLPLDEPCLVPRTGAGSPLSLSPLLRFRPADQQVTIDELFFLNAGTLQHVSYIGFRSPSAQNAESLGSYEAFRALMKSMPAPELPENPRLDFTALVSESTRFFVGREDVIAEIEAAVRARPAPYVEVRALPGMGKTSLFARLHERNPPREASLDAPQSGDRWCYHFCSHVDGRNSPIVMLRSLMAQAADAVGLTQDERDRYLKDPKSKDLKGLSEELVPAMLAFVASRLEADDRLILVVDALDEGFGAEESIASVLPQALPERVVALLSWRVDASGENSRVEAPLRRLSSAARHRVQSANPLRGLTPENVADFISRLRASLTEARANESQGAPSKALVDAVCAAAYTATGADPFYLRFLAQGAETGTVDLDRVESIPSSLDEAFEETWLALPTRNEFAAHRLLLILAILREPGTDTLLAELLTLERPSAPLTPSDVAALRIEIGKLLVYDAERYTLFHDRFKTFLVGVQPDPLEQNLAEAAS